MEKNISLSYWTGVVKRKGLYYNGMTKSDIASAVYRIITGDEKPFGANESVQYLARQYDAVQNMKKENGQVVYFIGNREYGWVKIGHTGDIKSRLSAIQVGCPFKVSILGTLRVTKETAKDSEAMLHKRFKMSRLNGEWFTLTDEMEKLIEMNADDVSPTAKVMPNVRVIPAIDFMDEIKISQRQKPRSRRR